ncbi:MuDR family transposase [Cucumis melo var. makuwa]|uniref:MuDR family transposase n=1 Tax=Cucumis melo var. makuwa TaxID=1194695 RepID=A0A5A7U815_CUCMM|nr:MuDR family transposase [Cucumis melo var. makuwa]TYK04157.1 MuDR family transposase [Cucumis melo var. makuwa]
MNGCNVYENYSVSGILVDMRVSFNSLASLIREQLELDESVELSVLLDFGKSNVQPVVPIKKNNDVAWYLAFVKDATSRHPLVAHVCVDCLGTSSSSSSVQGNGDMSLNIVKNNFQFRTTVSNLRSLEFRCLQEDCKWYVRASRYKKSDLWMLRKYTSDHDCSLSTAQSSHMQASLTVIGNCLIDDFRFISTNRSIPKEIVHKTRTNLGVNLPESLEGKRTYGTCTALEMDDSGHSKFCFMAFGASIEGWKYCRPIISVDRTFLKYSENDASWT